MKNTNALTFGVLAIVTVVVLLSMSLLNSDNKLLINPIDVNEKSSDVASEERKQTDPTSLVPKGTFKNLETGEVFDYIDGRGYLVSCGLSNCKEVIFDIADDGNIIQIRYSGDNPTFGRISSVSIAKENDEQVKYQIDYSLLDINYVSEYDASLCIHYKGGGVSCNSPAKVGQTVIVELKDGATNKISGITLFNRVLKASVLSVVNVDHNELINQK